eukprot:949567-Prorocentrum_minimum.AAC.1
MTSETRSLGPRASTPPPTGQASPREYTHTSCVRLVRHENMPARPASDWSVRLGQPLPSTRSCPGPRSS